MQNASLNFRVRHGHAIHLRTLVDTGEGRGRRDVRVESFGRSFGRDLVQLSADQVRVYAHALEPVDPQSAAALEALVFRPAPRDASAVSERDQERTAIASAVIAALAEAGMLKKVSGRAAD
jgi:hypothetical protein